MNYQMILRAIDAGVKDAKGLAAYLRGVRA